MAEGAPRRRVLVAEEIAEAGLERLRDRFDVDVRIGLDHTALVAAVDGASALIVRSATKVTADVIEAGSDLVVIGRAGIGLDNIDVAAATRAGVIVCNAPQSNVISAAEHTLALLLSLARHIPDANASLRGGVWRRSEFEGVELYGKTLGVVGLGRVGTLVAQRAHAFGMHLLAYDPFVTEERARQLGVDLLPLDEVLRRSDVITIHLPKSPDTVGLLDADRLALCKPTALLLNTARGGLVDEAALVDALRAGRLGGAAVDVFVHEPATESPLFGLPNVIVTPHLGASTREAQDKAGIAIADQVALALAGEFVPFAVNVAAGADVPGTLRPFIPLAECLGRLLAATCPSLDAPVHVEYEGTLADYDTRVLTLSVLKGIFAHLSDEPVTYVNAPLLAEARGIEVREHRSSTAHEYVNFIGVHVAGRARSVGGTLVGKSEAPRIVEIDGFSIDLPPSRYMLILRNDDVPGMIGKVGTALGAASVNIGNMALSRVEGENNALMGLNLDSPAPAEVLAEIRAIRGVREVMPVVLDA